MRVLRPLVLLACLLGPAAAQAANFTLINDATYATQKGAYDLECADLNGDGKPEVLVALFDHEWVAVLNNDGTGKFPAAQTQYPSNENAAIDVADVNGDHKVDFATANYNVSSMSIRFGQGVGGFGNRVTFTTGAHPRDLVSADLDGDGLRDYAVACEAGTVTLVHNRAALGFDPATTSFTVGGTLRAIGAADLDHDGLVDLVVLDKSGGRVVPYHNLGGMTFAALPAIAVPTSANDVLVQDLSQDGWADLAIADGTVSPYAQGSMTIVLNAGNGTFLPKKQSPDIESSGSLTAADMNGDGIVDLVSTDVAKGVRVTFGTGGGAFGEAIEESVNGPQAAAVADLNGDGRLDVVTGNYIPGSVSVLMGRRNLVGGPYHFETISNILCDQGGYDVATGDLDRDGHPDAVVANFDAFEVEVFRNLADGTGRLADPIRSNGGHAIAVDVGDYTGDGWDDVASANWTEGTVSLRKNHGDGTLEPPVDIAVGVNPRSLAGGDLDGDGLRDLVVGTYGGKFLTMKGTPAGLAPPVTQLSVSAGFKGAAIGDLDGDGVPDVALVDATNKKVYVLRNEGGMTFSPLTTLFLSNLLSDVAIADLDGDGDKDLALVNEDKLVQVCLNSGAGLFPAAKPYAVWPLSQTIAAADLDGNGSPELVVPAYDSFSRASRVQALANIGDGYYKGIQEAATGQLPRAAACADFDGDGRVDVVAIDYTAGTLHVFRNVAGVGVPAADPYPCDGDRYSPPSSPVHAIALDVDLDARADVVTVGNGLLSIFRNGPFGSHQDLATGAHPQAVAAGDLDGDGRPELAVANLDENTIEVYRNHAGGTFTKLADLPVGTHPRFVAIADLNRDGRLDLASANEGDGAHAPTVTILFNPPGADWNPQPEPIDGEAPAPDPPIAQAGGAPPLVDETLRVDLPFEGAAMLACADLDGDGATDLVVNEPLSHDVAIRYQTSPGRFGPAFHRPAGGSAWTGIGDFDTDGKPDLAIADPAGNVVRVLWNAASDPFTSETQIPVDQDPRSVAVGDLSGDGVPDIVYAASAQGWFGYVQTFPFHDFRYWARCISGDGARTVALAPNDQAPQFMDAYVVNAAEGTIFQWLSYSPLLSRTEHTAERSAPVFALGHPAPNPFAQKAALSFSLPVRGPAHLAVYDVRGRLVRTLLHGALEAGPHQAEWDGTNEARTKVGAGVYFCRLTCEAGTKVERMVRVGP